MTTHNFQVWAPGAQRVRLLLDGQEYPMTAATGGFWRTVPGEPEWRPGQRYGFLLDDDDQPLPDPRSVCQPDGVHGLSETFDLEAYPWADTAWTGRQLAGGSIYELHVGTFTAGPDGHGGTLDSAIDRLDHLVELGVDFVELMPVNSFNGPRGWGYDGVEWYAVQQSYGGPAAYQRFVDACHQRGLAVIQDVVYNHFGPSGNYLPKFGPYLKAGDTPWGAAVNIDAEDSDEVRRYIIDNALMWIRDFHVDGLRLDAVHALIDTSAVHILEQLATETDALSAFVGRPISLIAESDRNDPRMITTREAGGYGLTAQWNDDYHHAILANLTGTSTGYYADFASLDALSKTVETGYYHDGTMSTFRGRTHGRPIDTEKTQTWRLVVCSDNHDQIGNRATGERLGMQYDTNQLKIAAALVVLGPFTPMIFMGEEWGADTPFAFFTSHPEPELAEAVRKGRVEEFSKMEWAADEIPDPQAEQTFLDSMLDWNQVHQGAHGELFTWYQQLMDLRRSRPDVVDPRFMDVSAAFDIEGTWFVMRRGSKFSVAINMGDEPVTVPMDGIDPARLEVERLELAGEEVPEDLRNRDWETLMTSESIEITGESVTLGTHAVAVLSLVDSALG